MSAKNNVSSPSAATNEGTTQVRNLRERGKLYYSKGKDNSDWESVQMAVRLFRRGATYPTSANVSVEEIVKVSKNYLAAVKLLQQLILEEDDVEEFGVNRFFEEFEVIQQSYMTICTRVSELPAREYGRKWREHVTSTFYTIVSRAIKAISLVDSSDNSGLHVRTKKRLQHFERLLALVKCEEATLNAAVRLGIVQVLLKASITFAEGRKHTRALESILNCETYMPFLERENVSSNLSSVFMFEKIEDLKHQIWYQRCACESAVKIANGYALLQSATGEAEDKVDEGKLFLAVDAFKEAQVLARETSLVQEAQASARLAFIFRTVPKVGDKTKSDLYYRHAFTLLESEASAKLTEWGKDATTQRERIQREMAEKSDERRAPVLEKHKALLDRLRRKMGIECSDKKDIPGALEFLYKEYPPTKDEERNENEIMKVKAKLDKQEYNSALRLTVSHYHPDRNREDRVGFEHHVLCEEVTKIVNIMYSRLIKEL